MVVARDHRVRIVGEREPVPGAGRPLPRNRDLEGSVAVNDEVAVVEIRHDAGRPTPVVGTAIDTHRQIHGVAACAPDAILEVGGNRREVVERIAVIPTPLEGRADDGNEGRTPRVGAEIDLQRGVQRVGQVAVALGHAHLVLERAFAFEECSIGVTQQVAQLAECVPRLPSRHDPDVTDRACIGSPPVRPIAVCVPAHRTSASENGANPAARSFRRPCEATPSELRTSRLDTGNVRCLVERSEPEPRRARRYAAEIPVGHATVTVDRLR